MSVVAIIQARKGSTRFPDKILSQINGMSLLEILLQRLKKSKMIDKIVVAIPNNKENRILNEYVISNEVSVFEGDEENLLDRFYKASLKFNASTIVRITSDCPLIDYEIIDKVINLYNKESAEFASNTNPPTFPDGMDVEVCSFNALQTAWKNASSSFHKEHVMPYIIESKNFKTVNLANRVDLSDLRLTVDEKEDLTVIKNIFNHFRSNVNFSLQDIITLYEKNPELFLENKHIKRNEGKKMNKGQKLWERAKKVIPGGNMLLSKRSEMFLPNIWPNYYSKAKGCKIWDLENNCYTDMSLMGVGTNILGYSNRRIDTAVKSAADNGNMTTLNTPDEVYLAEKIIDIHPWAEMVRFARSGGEINAVAVRIARAATGKDKIAFCGYHGWHDWYIASNIENAKNLDSHLLDGLKANGVPKALEGTSIPFRYNNFDELKKIIEDNEDIGVIKMEVERNEPPKNDFLKKVRKLATEKNIVLIFDECTSGFRETFGGLHKKYEVEPDLAIFGKSLGNGYAISAVIGRRDIMEAAQSTFISSTFWTERIGYVAAIKTLELMESLKSWEIITNKGKKLSKLWLEIAKSNSIKIDLFGIPSLRRFKIDSHDHIKYKTLITQELLKKNFLATDTVYLSTVHDDNIIDEYIEHLNEVFSIIRKCEDGLNVDDLIESEICHSGFSRLN